MAEEYQVETITGVALPYSGGMPLICHAGSVSPGLRRLFERAGLSLPENLQIYRGTEEAVALAHAHRAAGKRLAYVYPPLPELGEAGLLLPIDLYYWLNDKASMEHLVHAVFLPKRQLVSLETALSRDFSPPDSPCYLKVSHGEVSASGRGVRSCAGAHAWKAAVESLQAIGFPIERILVEEAVPARTSWCLNLAVLEEGVRYLGGPTQLFNAESVQYGGRIDPDDLPPVSAIEVAKSVCEVASGFGYRGVVGFDVGVTHEGAVYVFDLNFRVVGSTAQSLFHESATKRVGARVSESFTVVVDAELDKVEDVVGPYVDSGRFVPLKIFDSGHAGFGQTVIGGIVVGDSVTEAADLAGEITRRVTEAVA